MLTRQSLSIDTGVVILNTVSQTFDLKQIRNRRFMYSPKHHTLILGDAMAGVKISGSHAEEFHQSGAPGQFDDYIRGWIGRNSTDYKRGIIHFAPQIYTGNLDDGLSFLHYVTNIKGVNHNTRVRGFIHVSECCLSEIIPSKFSK